MANRQYGRMIAMHTNSARIEDGVELRTVESLPSPWRDGDILAVELAANDRATLIAEPDEGPDTFSYKPNSYSTWHIRLERLPADQRGHYGLRVRFEEHHKEIQQHDDERQR